LEVLGRAAGGECRRTKWQENATVLRCCAQRRRVGRARQEGRTDKQAEKELPCPQNQERQETDREEGLVVVGKSLPIRENDGLQKKSGVWGVAGAGSACSVRQLRVCVQCGSGVRRQAGGAVWFRPPADEPAPCGGFKNAMNQALNSARTYPGREILQRADIRQG